MVYIGERRGASGARQLAGQWPALKTKDGRESICSAGSRSSLSFVDNLIVEKMIPFVAYRYDDPKGDHQRTSKRMCINVGTISGQAGFLYIGHPVIAFVRSTKSNEGNCTPDRTSYTYSTLVFSFLFARSYFLKHNMFSTSYQYSSVRLFPSPFLTLFVVFLLRCTQRRTGRAI